MPWPRAATLTWPKPTLSQPDGSASRFTNVRLSHGRSSAETRSSSYWQDAGEWCQTLPCTVAAARTNTEGARIMTDAKFNDKREHSIGPRGGKHCSRCHQRPARRPRAWNRPDVTVTGPALCGQCAKRLVVIGSAVLYAPSDDL
jgi:hypothetical protein